MNSSMLTFKLIQEVGLDVTNDNIVIDQDFRNIILLDGQTIMKFDISGAMPVLFQNELYFDPVNNIRIARFIFNYYLNKINHLDNRYFNVFYEIEEVPGSLKRALVIKNNNEVYKSGYYYKESLRIIDLIIQMEGEFMVNLSHYDISDIFVPNNQQIIKG